MIKFIKFNCAVYLGLALSLWLPAQASERVALILGNSQYQNVAYLPNPKNDAQDLAQALKALQFKVILRTDLNLRGMHRALKDFRKALRGSELGLFFFAGHGAQFDNSNYLIPLKAEIGETADLQIESLSADWILTQMREAGDQVNVIILDACRNNPYLSGSRASRGLARIKAQSRGALFAYATSPDKIAADGEGRNSPYTAALLNQLKKPNRSLVDFFNAVGYEVSNRTQDRQIPWYSASPLPPIHLASLQTQEQENESGSFVGPQMVRIKAGCYQMGSPESEKGREDDEGQHRVCVDDFQIGRYEVTVAEFRRFVESTGYKTEAERYVIKEGCYSFDEEYSVGWRAGASWRNPNPNHAYQETHPVSCVSWNDAQAYLEWLSKETGLAYRLPTEAEWEYAARAGTTRARYWGEDADQACRYANVADKTKGPNNHSWKEVHDCRDEHFFVAPVGRYQANAWQLYDMLGNVWEWTCSSYKGVYDGTEGQCLSKNNANNSARLVIRGGSWFDWPRWVRSAVRNRSAPSYRYTRLGFRPARS